MKIAVSACLLGRHCRYDGGSCYDENLVQALEGHTIIPLCPECLAGLPTPRTPMELKEGKMLTKDGRDLTDQMEKAIEKAVTLCKEEGVELAVLMDRSPTCGVHTVYDGTFSSRLIDGQGLLVKRLTQAGIQCVSKQLITVVKST